MTQFDEMDKEEQEAFKKYISHMMKETEKIFCPNDKFFIKKAEIQLEYKETKEPLVFRYNNPDNK